MLWLASPYYSSSIFLLTWYQSQFDVGFSYFLFCTLWHHYLCSSVSWDSWLCCMWRLSSPRAVDVVLWVSLGSFFCNKFFFVRFLFLLHWPCFSPRAVGASFIYINDVVSVPARIWLCHLYQRCCISICRRLPESACRLFWSLFFSLLTRICSSFWFWWVASAGFQVSFSAKFVIYLLGSHGR